MVDLIENEQGLFVAKQDGKVVAFVMAASGSTGHRGRCLPI